MSAAAVCIVAAAIGGLIGLAIGYLFLHAEVGRRAATRTFAYILVVFVLTTLVVAGVTVATRGATRRHILEALFLVSMLGLWAGVGWFVAGRVAGGRVLVVMPRLPRQWLALGGMALFVLGQAWQRGRNGSVLAALIHVEQVSFVVYILIAALSRPQLRERGVLFTTFLPWWALESYAWEGDDGQTLTLRRRRMMLGWLLSYPKLSVRVPSEDRDRVDNVLRRYLTVPDHASSRPV